MGFNLAAFKAGYKPNTIPIKLDTPTASKIESIVITPSKPSAWLAKLLSLC